jgi:cytochrome c peroxidase
MGGGGWDIGRILTTIFTGGASEVVNEVSGGALFPDKKAESVVEQAAVPEPPPVPAVEPAAEEAATKITEKRKAVARSRSVFTSPMGLSSLSNTSNLAKKYLLGE